MNKFKILFVTLIFFSCKNEDKLQTIGVKNKSTKTENKSSDKNISVDSTSIIQDTLVFSKNMIGELLDNKIKESQEKLQFYKKFIRTEKINQKQIIDEKHTKTEIVFLGIIKDIENQNSYRVITNFKVIGIDEMLSPRGKSEIAFIDNKNIIMVYDMGMPENLPKYIDNNTLHFEIEKTKIGIMISGGLAPMFCLPKIGCNE